MFIMTGSSKDTYIGQYIFDGSEFGIWETNIIQENLNMNSITLETKTKIVCYA